MIKRSDENPPVEEFVTAEEYPGYFGKLNGLRGEVAADLPIKPGMRVLDMTAGHGFFTIEMLRRELSLRVTGIDISQRGIPRAKENLKEAGLEGKAEFIFMDATDMGFGDDEFDMVAGFLGIEDIHMSRGREGVKKAFKEVGRVLKPDGRFAFVGMPPEEMETEAQKIEVAVYSFACGATWLSAYEYSDMLASAGLGIVETKTYYTGKKLTAEQAREETRFACEVAPEVYGIETRSFEEVWERFGARIEEHGLGQCSKVMLFVCKEA